MKYKRDKDDYVYSLQYNEQILYYFDDSLFLGEELNEELYSRDIPRISELTEYIEEFSKHFDVDYYSSDAILKIEFIRETIDTSEIPVVCNSKNKAVKFNTKCIMNETIDGKEVFDCKINLIIDLSKTFDEIICDLGKLEELNDFFTIEKLFNLLGINSNKNFKDYISAERMFMLDKDEYSFIMMEYCHLRKYAGLSESSAQYCLKKIYKFEDEL